MAKAKVISIKHKSRPKPDPVTTVTLNFVAKNPTATIMANLTLDTSITRAKLLKLLQDAVVFVETGIAPPGDFAGLVSTLPIDVMKGFE